MIKWLDVVDNNQLQALASSHNLQLTTSTLSFLESFAHLVNRASTTRRNLLAAAITRRTDLRTVNSVIANEVSHLQHQYPHLHIIPYRHPETSLPIVFVRLQAVPELVIHIFRSYANTKRGLSFGFRTYSFCRGPLTGPLARAANYLRARCVASSWNLSLSQLISLWAAQVEAIPMHHTHIPFTPRTNPTNTNINTTRRRRREKPKSPPPLLTDPDLHVIMKDDKLLPNRTFEDPEEMYAEQVRAIRRKKKPGPGMLDDYQLAYNKRHQPQSTPHSSPHAPFSSFQRPAATKPSEPEPQEHPAFSFQSPVSLALDTARPAEPRPSPPLMETDQEEGQIPEHAAATIAAAERAVMSQPVPTTNLPSSQPQLANPANRNHDADDDAPPLFFFSTPMDTDIRPAVDSATATGAPSEMEDTVEAIKNPPVVPPPMEELRDDASPVTPPLTDQPRNDRFKGPLPPTEKPGRDTHKVTLPPTQEPRKEDEADVSLEEGEIEAELKDAKDIAKPSFSFSEQIGGPPVPEKHGSATLTAVDKVVVTAAAKPPEGASFENAEEVQKNAGEGQSMEDGEIQTGLSPRKDTDGKEAQKNGNNVSKVPALSKRHGLAFRSAPAPDVNENIDTARATDMSAERATVAADATEPTPGIRRDSEAEPAAEDGQTQYASNRTEGMELHREKMVPPSDMVPLSDTIERKPGGIGVQGTDAEVSNKRNREVQCSDEIIIVDPDSGEEEEISKRAKKRRLSPPTDKEGIGRQAEEKDRNAVLALESPSDKIDRPPKQVEVEGLQKTVIGAKEQKGMQNGSNRGEGKVIATETLDRHAEKPSPRNVSTWNAERTKAVPPVGVPTKDTEDKRDHERAAERHPSGRSKAPRGVERDPKPFSGFDRSTIPAGVDFDPCPMALSEPSESSEESSDRDSNSDAGSISDGLPNADFR